MKLLLHISDTHFGTERGMVVNALRRLALRERPDVVVLSGDITQRARPAQFAAARSFVDSLQIPKLLAIPGNHDISLFNPLARLLQPYRRYRKCFGTDLEPQLDSAELLVLTTKTTRRYRHVDGELSRRQIERVARSLAAASPQQLRIVVTHQPLAVTDGHERHNLLHRHAEAIRTWSQAGADLLLGGHIHLPFVRPLHESIPGLARRTWVVQAGTAVSSRIRHEADNSVNLIRIGSRLRPDQPAVDVARHATVERWDFDPAQGEFVVREQHALSCDVDSPGVAKSRRASIE